MNDNCLMIVLPALFGSNRWVVVSLRVVGMLSIIEDRLFAHISTLRERHLMVDDDNAHHFLPRQSVVSPRLLLLPHHHPICVHDIPVSTSYARASSSNICICFGEYDDDSFNCCFSFVFLGSNVTRGSKSNNNGGCLHSLRFDSIFYGAGDSHYGWWIFRKCTRR